MNDLELRKAHPEWYHATDYKWLREHRPLRTDISRWNRLDDENRRVMANWSYNVFTMKTPEEDAAFLVRHRNRAGLTSDERNDTMYAEKSFKEVGKALREEQTVNNPTERNTRLRPRGLGRQASSTRQTSGEQSTRQDTASSARLQLTQQ